MHRAFSLVAALGGVGAVTGQQFVDRTAACLPDGNELSMAVATGDFNKDGATDIVWGNATTPSTLELNDGRGKFVRVPSPFPKALSDVVMSIAVGDVDRDGNLDVYFAMADQDRLFLGDGRAGFVDRTLNLPVSSASTDHAVFADVDGDRDLDVVLARIRDLRLYLNDGKGFFRDSTAGRIPKTLVAPSRVAAGDVDGNGTIDLIVADHRTRRLLVNTGRGVFLDLTKARMPSHDELVSDITLGDVDGDGDLDLFAGNYYHADRLYLNGGGRFADASSRLPAKRALTRRAALVDVDFDGDVDIVMLKERLGALPERPRLYLNGGRGTFSDVTAARLPSPANLEVAMAVADTDVDGDPDILFAQSGARNRVWINRLRHVESRTVPRTGSMHLLEVHARSGFAAAGQIAQPFVSLLRLQPRIAVPPFGSFGLDPRAFVAGPPLPVPAPSGVLQVRFGIPNIRQLVGQTLHGQALVLHGARPDRWRLSNVSADKIQ